MPVNVTIQNNSGRVFSLILKKYIIRLNEVRNFLEISFKKMKKFPKNYH